MLEQTRRQGASLILYLIFGVLIIGFVINFTPFGRGRGAEGGCDPSAGTAITIEGSIIGVRNITKTAPDSRLRLRATPRAASDATETVIAAVARPIEKDRIIAPSHSGD